MLCSMKMLNMQGLYTCCIKWCVDKDWVVRGTLHARVLLGLGGVRIKASLLGRSGGLHLGNMMIFMRMSEVTLWRDGMQTFYCDEVFGSLEGCVPRVIVDACAEERLRGRRDLS